MNARDVLATLDGHADTDDVWQHGPTREIVAGALGDDVDGEWVLIGTVAEVRSEYQDLIDAA